MWQHNHANLFNDMGQLRTSNGLRLRNAPCKAIAITSYWVYKDRKLINYINKAKLLDIDKITNALKICTLVFFIKFQVFDCFAQGYSVLHNDALRAELNFAKNEEQKLRNFCEKILNPSSCLSGNGGHGFQEIQCYAVGTGLGLNENIKHLRPQFLISASSSDRSNAYDAAEVAGKYDLLQTVINNILGKSSDEFSQIWNLNCSGKYGINKSTIETYGNFFRYNKKSGLLSILGDVDKNFSDKLNAAIANSPGVKTIGLSSGGGYVNQALIAGRTIRRLGLNTQIEGACYSACPLVYIGGINRISFSPHPVLGFHQISTNSNAVAFNHKIYAEVYYYLREMRVDEDIFLRAMMSASPHEMKNIKANEEVMCRANVVTWAQHGCNSSTYGW